MLGHATHALVGKQLAHIRLGIPRKAGIERGPQSINVGARIGHAIVKLFGSEIWIWRPTHAGGLPVEADVEQLDASLMLLEVLWFQSEVIDLLIVKRDQRLERLFGPGSQVTPAKGLFLA